MTVSQADADFALVVTGNVKDTAGQTPASAFTIRVRNEASGIEAESQTTADGTFKVVLFANVLADPEATVTDAGDTLQITVLNTAGEVVGAQSYELTVEDLVNAVVPIDLEVDSAPVESDGVLAIVGNLRDTRGHAITERFTIRAEIAVRNIEAESQTSLTGRYNVQLVGDESFGVGDTLELSAINAGGESLVSQTYQLTTADLANGFAIVDLTVQPIPSDAARAVLVVTDS